MIFYVHRAAQKMRVDIYICVYVYTASNINYQHTSTGQLLQNVERESGLLPVFNG